MEYQYKFTVFTPTYNRAYIIERLYHSLQNQTYRDFEWLVVDDGSTDGTKELFDRFMCESKFPIRYLQVSNGGKHRAINIGVRTARGELFFIVDSDDYIVDDALEKLATIEKTIPKDGKVKYSGIRALRGRSMADIIGTSFPGEQMVDLTQLEEAKLGVTGDKCEAFYTSIMKNFPFPEFENEKFLTECVVWDKIAANGYKNRCFNEVIYICDYLADGLTANIKERHKKNPKGTGLYIYQSIKYKKISGWDKRYTVLNYYNLHLEEMSLNEIAGNLQTSKYKLVLYIKWINVRIFIRRKWKGIKRRIVQFKI